MKAGELKKGDVFYIGDEPYLVKGVWLHSLKNIEVATVTCDNGEVMNFMVHTILREAI